MNILIVTAMFPPIRTGTSFYSKNLATALHEGGHNVLVVSIRNREAGDETYPFRVVRLKALHLKLKNYFKHLRFSSVFLSNYFSLARLARDHQTEAILLVNHYLDIAFPAIYAAQRTKKPLYISVGTQMQSLNPFRNQILRTLDRLICGHLIFPFAKHIISWDSEIERYIREVQGEKVASKSVIIPFGANGSQKTFINYQHDYSQVTQIIGVGAIISQRDYLFNLRVFKELLKEFPQLRLKIIGHIYIDSPLKLAKELGLTDKVDFMGEVPHEQVIEELKRSTLHWMMLSGRYVGLGTATIEAMSLGIPCISNVPQSLFKEDKLIDMQNYVYVDNGDILTAVNKISEVIKDQSLRGIIGLNGRTFIHRNLNWVNVVNKMTVLLNNK